MTSRERISKTLRFETPDRIGIVDDLTDGAIKRWRNEGLSKGVSPEEYFEFDIRMFGFDQMHRLQKGVKPTLSRIDRPSVGEGLADTYEAARGSKRFIALSFCEPFEDVSRVIGRVQLLQMMAENEKAASRLLGISFEYAVNMCQLLLDKGYCFDGAWMWGDLAYRNTTFFSADYYNKFLFDLHREFCDFFSGHNMPVILHCDGNMETMIPGFIDAGVRAVSPLESDVGMDLSRIKREYGRDVVLFGGIDEARMSDAGSFADELKGKFDMFMAGGGYIYHADSPVPENVSLGEYKRCLAAVTENGSYK